MEISSSASSASVIGSPPRLKISPSAASFAPGEQQRLDHVVDVVHVAPLAPLAEEFDDAAVHRLPDEPRDETEAVVADELARAVGVRQPQADGARAVEPMVEQVVVLGGQLVDAVDVERRDAVLLVQRQVDGAAVNLTRAGEDDLDVRVEVAARLKQRERGGAVVPEVTQRVAYRVNVADAAREVEDVVHAADDVVDDLLVADVDAVDFDAVAHVGDVEGVAALVGQQRVEHRDLRADLDEAAHEVAADEAEAAGDERRAPLVLAKKFRLAHVLRERFGGVRPTRPPRRRSRAGAPAFSHSPSRSSAVRPTRRRVKNCERPCARG